MDPGRFPVPPGIVARARQLAEGRLTPVVPRSASTVVLLRDGQAGVEAYVLRRRRTMAFAPGMYVFPGGTVDVRDSEAGLAWAGPAPSAWAERLGFLPASGEAASPGQANRGQADVGQADVGQADAGQADAGQADAGQADAGQAGSERDVGSSQAELDAGSAAARASVCAVVRELFEETGVLLAGPTPDSVVADTTGEDWERDRRGLLGREESMREMLVRRGLVLRSDLLAACGHWLTPEAEERRYDTRFYLAALPAGQRTRDISSEADRVAWMRPAEAAASVEAGEMEMLPPTAATLEALEPFASVADALAAAGTWPIRRIMPTVGLDGDEPRWVVPS